MRVAKYLFTSLRDGNRPHRMEGDNISTEHSPGSDPAREKMLLFLNLIFPYLCS